MKEAIVQTDVSVTIQDSPILSPGPHQVLVKVVVAGTNPKDWKFPVDSKNPHNSGDDLAGIVEAVGEKVCEFRKGDRVAGMHCFPLPHGAFAEYAILNDYMTFHIPDQTSFEDAATIPLAYLTAAFGLFYVLGLPAPWNRAPKPKTPLIVYGASTAVGAFAIKLASAAGMHPLIAIGSSNSAFMKEYLDASQGDVLIDYRAHPTHESLRQAIQDAARASHIADGRMPHAFDAVALPGTFDAVLGKAMAGAPINGVKPKIAAVDPFGDYSNVDASVEVETTYCGLGHEGDEDAVRFTASVFRMATAGLSYGWLKGHPYEVTPGGLAGVEGALKASKEGKIKAKKLVIRIADTQGV